MRIKFLDRKSTAEKIIYTIVFILFTAFALSYLYIFFWGIVATLKTHTENVMKPFAFPEVAQWKNFKEVFTLFTPNNTTFFTLHISLFRGNAPTAPLYLLSPIIPHVLPANNIPFAKNHLGIDFLIFLFTRRNFHRLQLRMIA